ncbi:MAG TPA: fibronectin type III domain-containing protein, partial [Bacteroidales bacterium]|nr:fibronectin type III domain-containing protein [Bacteroidales bacterium]
MNAKTYFSKVAFVLVSILLMFQFSLRSQTVTNGDFESWTAGNPDGWTINVISSSLTFTQASGLGVTGDALQILSQSNPGGYDGNFSTVVTGITPGSYYNLSVMVKGNDDMLKLRYFSMQWLDASDAQIGANIDENTFSPNTSNAWTAFELFTNPIQAPAGAAKLVVNFRAYNGVGYTAGSTTLWVDDLTVTEQIFIDPDRTAGDVTQTSDLVGGSLNFVFDAGTYVCDITQPIGENVPWVVTNATYAPYSGNWIGVAIDFPAGFTGASDIVALNIDGVAQTGPFLSAEETAAGELWYYFEMDGASDVTHTLVVNWDGLNQYETEIFVINAIDLALQENPAIQQGIDNTDLTLTPATQTIMTTDNAVVNMTLDMPLYDADFPADMYGDVLFTFSNALPAGANILITQDATTVADYTATGGETSLWFFEDMSATLDRIPMTDFDDNTYNFVITFSNMSVQTTYNMTVSLIGDLMTGFTNPADWYVFASDNAEIIVSDVPLFTIPLYEGFESGFTYFGNQTGNQVNFTEVTSFVFAGTKAVQNAYGVSNNNKLVMLGPVNLSSVTNPILKFAQIAETEANYDHCYVEISLDGGTTWTILPASAYQGSGTYSVPTQNIPEGPCFTETAYSVWNSSDVVSNTWWRTEKFSLSAYIGQSSVMIRFRLKSDIYVQKTGWFLDAIQIYDELCSEPTAFATTNLWSDGATFAWTSTASLWNIEVGASGFVPGTGAAVATFTGVTTNPFQVSGLSPATTYQAYIQANCGGANGVSLWTGPVTFTTLPACPAPTNVTVTNITISGAQVNWTQPGLPNTWDLIYGLTGFNPGIEGTLINNSTTNPTTISGLSAQTNYQVYVRADCGGTTSAWVGPISFSTPCTAVSTFPFTESFNGTTFAPMCWTNVKVSGTGTPGIWDRQTAGTSPTCTPHSGAGMARYNSYNLSSGTNGILATPALEFPSDNYQVVFWMYRDNGYATYSNEKVNVYYNTQNSLTGATQLGSISRYYGFAPAVATANAWYEYTFFLPAGVSGTGYIIFQAVSQFGNNMFIDDITVMEKPPCPVPASPASSNVLGNQATLSWTGGASATSYEIIYGPQGFNPSTSGTLITGIAGSPYTLTGLTSATAYSFYVRTNCGGTLTDWSTVSNFTTSCDVIDDFTWTEEFTTWSNITTCWNLTGGSQTPLHYNNSALHANYWSWSSGTTAYAASPIFDISGLTNPAIEFFWSHQYSSSYPNDRLVLQVSDDGGATWDDLWDKSGANFNSNDGAGNTTPGSYKTTGYIDISAYTGNIKFRFYFYSGYGPDVFIDKVSILDLPSCMFPSALTASNLTNTTADLAWVESFGATVWDVIYGAPGFDPETEGTLMADLTTNPYTLGSLDDGTTYEAYVRSNCGGGDVSPWVGPVSFTTVPYCLSPVSLAAGSITVDGASITWTDPGTATAYDLIYGADGFDPLTEGTLAEDVTSPYVISGLNPATAYDVYVRSDCSGDNSPWSTVLNFNTLLCNTGDQCVFDFDLLDSWGDGWNGNSIDIYQAGIFVQNLTLASGSSASVNVNLCPGLESYIVYHTGSYISEVSFTITAPWGDVIYTGSGFTDASNNQTIFTWYSDCVPPTCPIPSAFAIGDEGIDNVSLSWTEEGTATMWDVIYGVPGFDNETEGTIVQDVADNDPYTLSGLSPETTYEVYVRSDCGAGDESYWVGPLSFTTLPSCPDPWDFAVTNVTYNAGEFNWTDYGVATQWDIIYGDPGFDPETEGTLEAAITMAPHVITGFTPETQYEAYLRADCGAGDYSNWVGPISFTTTPTCPTPSDISASNITANSA